MKVRQLRQILLLASDEQDEQDVFIQIKSLEKHGSCPHLHGSAPVNFADSVLLPDDKTVFVISNK